MEQERQARRSRARERAERLLDAALESPAGGHDALADVVRRVADALGVERCELLGFAGDRGAVLYRVRHDTTRRGGARVDEPGSGREGMVPDRVWVEAVQLVPKRSPFDLLRGDGTFERVYVFIAGAGREPFGILSVQSSVTRHLTVDERAFLDAVADLLSAAAARGELPRLWDPVAAVESA
jgi:hypothetical protein